jgi:hypothetical protein
MENPINVIQFKDAKSQTTVTVTVNPKIMKCYISICGYSFQTKQSSL